MIFKVFSLIICYNVLYRIILGLFEVVTLKILLLFIDGFGLGPDNPDLNPLSRANIPFLNNLLSGKEGCLVKTDTLLGVKGIPQSATGQTALLTGINAPGKMGRHISGFPGPVLKEIVNNNNIFIKLNNIGRKATFANAYTTEYLDSLSSGEKIRASVTTLSVLSAGLAFRKISQLIEGRAVYQDFTNRVLIERGYYVPVFSPEKAALNLVNILRDNDFTLYEYFQTDRIGHSQDFNKAINLLEDLNRFLKELLSRIDPEKNLVIITSDHGNIEDLSTNTHTTNPVPTILLGKDSISLKDKIRDLTDITPVILSLFT